MKRKNNMVYFILPALWMALIFYFSSQPADISSMNNGFIVEILYKIGIDLPKLLGKDTANLLIRKGAHVAEYFVLFILSYRAFLKSGFSRPLLLAAVFSGIYAGTDEVHQIFVPGRAGMFKDVLIDFIGIIAGAALAFVRRRCFDHLSGKPRDSSRF